MGGRGAAGMAGNRYCAACVGGGAVFSTACLARVTRFQARYSPTKSMGRISLGTRINTRSRNLRTVARLGAVAVALGLTVIGGSAAIAATTPASANSQVVLEESSEASQSPDPGQSDDTGGGGQSPPPATLSPPPATQSAPSTGGDGTGGGNQEAPAGNNGGQLAGNPAANQPARKPDRYNNTNNQGGLATTGTNVGLIAGVGAALTLGGVGLVLISRRRRQTTPAETA